jgi:pimeloyl-ACP methyl ester carboxylesterase
MTPLAPAAMKWRKGLRAAFGVALCIAGFALAWATPYRETTVILGAGGCRLVTDVVDRGNDDTQGYVVLFHGLAANKKIMSYLARGFASQNLRVFVPDLPGHGRAPGPFSFERAEACADAFVRELILRRAIDPQRTMLAGHSMGGAIALRVAARVRVAGVVAISPAPQRVAHGVPPDMLPYTNPPPLPPHTLAISAAFEPLGIRDSTRDLIAGESAATGKYLFMPGATHVSVLGDSRVVRASQEWTAETLKFRAAPGAPSSLPLVGSLAGLAGILLLAGPFVRETMGMQRPSPQAAAADQQNVSGAPPAVPVFRALLETAAVSLLAVVLLGFWDPLSFVRLYNGGYFASFLLIVGFALLLVHHKSVRALWPTKISVLLLASLAGFVLHLLVTGWLDATFTESWLSWARWARFPVLFVAALVYLLAEELLLGPVGARGSLARLGLASALRLIAFIALVSGIFVLHSGAILVLLLAVYLALFFLFQRLGMDLVRRQTGSAIAAAVFGAILLAGFCLVIFPVT